MVRHRWFDPLYGAVLFNGDDAKLIFSAEVQRLRYIRMCNINSLLITGASEPSRFEHVLGVLCLAVEWAAASQLTTIDARVVRAAALLHDFQTGPFGHSFEYVLDDNALARGFRHEDVQSGSQLKFLQSTNYNVAFSGVRFSAQKALGDLWPRVAEAIAGHGRFGPIIAGTVDLDNLDNVVRLAYHTGVATKGDSEISLGLAHDIKIQAGRLCVSRNGLELLDRWQCVRERLYCLLLHDWAEFSAKAMLTTMMELAVEHQVLGPDSWLLTDDELMSVFQTETIGEPQYIGELARRLRSGDLFDPLLLWRTPRFEKYGQLSSVQAKRALEREISEVVHCRCIFHVILDKGKTRRALQITLREDDTLRRIGENSEEMLVGLFLSRPDVPTTARRAATALLRERLDLASDEFAEIDDPVMNSQRERELQPELF